MSVAAGRRMETRRRAGSEARDRLREEEAASQRRGRPSGLEVGEASVTNRRGWRWAGLMGEASGSAAANQRREKGRRGERRVVGPTGGKIIFSHGS